MPRRLDAVDKRLARLVVFECARIGDGQNRDAERNEAAHFVYPDHYFAPMVRAAVKYQSGRLL
ncbi:hypothetical protein D3C87_2167120 [compost metagenome]